MMFKHNKKSVRPSARADPLGRPRDDTCCLFAVLVLFLYWICFLFMFLPLHVEDTFGGVVPTSSPSPPSFRPASLRFCDLAALLWDDNKPSSHPFPGFWQATSCTSLVSDDSEADYQDNTSRHTLARTPRLWAASASSRSAMVSGSRSA